MKASNSARSILIGFILFLINGLAGAQSRPAPFLDEFSSADGSTDKWEITLNGGKFAFAADGLRLTGVGAGSPILKTRSNPFPAQGQWTVSFAYRYTRKGNYGTGIQGVTDSRGSDNPSSFVFMLHQDINGQFFALNGHKVWRTGIDLAWHVISVVRNSDLLTAYIDGKKAGQETGIKLPTMLRIGGGLLSSPWDWNDLQIRYVRVDAGEAIHDLTSLPTTSVQEPLTGRDTQIAPPLPAQTSIAQKPSNALNLSAVLGVEKTSPPPAYPADDNRLVVQAADTTVNLPKRASILLTPVLNSPGFLPDQVHLYVNQQLVETKAAVPNRPLPVFIVEAPRGTPSVKRIKIVVQDGFKKTADVLRCTLYADGQQVGVGAVFAVKDERLILTLPKGQSSTALYLFLENDYLGRMVGDVGKFSVDARRLPIGRFRLWAVAEDGEGRILAPSESIVEIRPRYRITSTATQGTVEVDKDVDSTRVKFSRDSSSSIVKSLVYVAGSFVGESSQSEFEMNVPLTDVPTGIAQVEVVGIDREGYPYPPESIGIKVQNYALNAVAAVNQQRKDLQGMTARIAQLDQEIEYWYTRANQEPDFITYSTGFHTTSILAVGGFARLVSTSYLDSITVPGRVAQCLGYCRAAVLKRSQVRFEIGKLQKQLGNREAARSTFEQVVRETGESSGIGALAAQELRDVR